MKKYLFVLMILLYLCFGRLAWAEELSQLDYKISGLDSKELFDNTLKTLKNEAKVYSQPWSEETINKLYQQAPEVIKKSLQPFGYFESKITKKKLKKIGSQHWLADFRVKAGPTLKISKLDIEITGAGAKQKTFVNAQKELPLKIGQVLLMENYNQAKNSLKHTAADQGYLSAELLEKEVLIDLKNYTAGVILHFDTGPQYYFGAITLKNELYSPKFLNRFLNFSSGDTYSSESLIQLQQHLTNTIYFSKVSVHPDVTASINQRVPVDIQLTPSKAQQYDFGIGVGTDTGVRASSGVQLRHLGKMGQYFQGNIVASQAQTNMLARYYIPGKNPVSDQYFIGASIENEDVNSSKGESKKVSVGYTDNYRDWQRSISLNAQYDHYSLRRAPYEDTFLILPSLTLLHSNVDNVLFPRKGKRINLNLRGASKALFSSSSFAQIEVDARLVVSPSDETRILLRTDAAYTLVNNLEKIPLSLQYFAGGARSIRGYSYRELGPGRYLLIASAEFQLQLKDKWFGAFFIDAGNAINSLSDPSGKIIGRPRSTINTSQLLKYSVGLGIVYVTPIGPVEVTIAKPITDSNKSPKLQLTMGADL